VIAYCL